MMVMLPLTVAAEVGVNTTVMTLEEPALMVTGVAMPETLKGAPLTLIIETFRSALPLFESVTFVLVLLPTAALPASRLDGLTASCGAGVAATADTPICTGAMLPLAAWKVKVPESLPAADPVNQTSKLVVCPAVRVNGKFTPEIVKALFEDAICAMTTVVLAVLVTEALCEAFLPATTLPKFKLDGENCSDTCCEAIGASPLMLPTQPAVNVTAKSAASRSAQGWTTRLVRLPRPAMWWRLDDLMLICSFPLALART